MGESANAQVPSSLVCSLARMCRSPILDHKHTPVPLLVQGGVELQKGAFKDLLDILLAIESSCPAPRPALMSLLRRVLPRSSRMSGPLRPSATHPHNMINFQPLQKVG